MRKELEDAIEKLADIEPDFLNWPLISENSTNINLIKKNMNRIDKRKLSCNCAGNVDMIGAFIDKIDLDAVLSKAIYPFSFYEKYAEKFNEDNWYTISKYQYLDIETIKKFKDKINIFKYVHSHNISSDLGKEILEIYEWDKRVIENIFKKCQFEESFIYDNISKITSSDVWAAISKYKNLSEEFIEKNSDKIIWDYISRYQILSDSFISRHEKEITFPRPDIILYNGIRLTWNEFLSKNIISDQLINSFVYNIQCLRKTYFLDKFAVYINESLDVNSIRFMKDYN